MPKVNIRETDPVRYAKVKAEQDELNKKCDTAMTVARLCPYCNHKITILCSGSHSYAKEKCPNCGENVTFPPISFRLSRAANR